MPSKNPLSRIWTPSFGKEIESRFGERGILFRPNSAWERFYVRDKTEDGAIVGLNRADEAGTTHRGYLKIFGSAEDFKAACDRYASFSKEDRFAFALSTGNTIYFHYPFDRRISGLKHVASSRRLKHYMHESIRGFSPAETRIREGKTTLNLLRHKPERRVVLRALMGTRSARTGAKEVTDLIVRAHADRSGENAAAMLAEFEPAATFRIPEPVHYDSAFRIAINRWVHGVPVLGSWARGESDWTAYAAGQALRELHNFAPSVPIGAGSSPVPTARARQVLCDLRVYVPDAVEHLLPLVERPLVARTPTRVIHGDFYYAQIIWNGTDGADASIGIIDWDECRPGDALEDIANFLAHILYLELEQRIPDGFASRLEEQFIKGYGGTLPEDLQQWTACHLLMLAMRPLRSLAEDWEKRSRGILLKAESLLCSKGIVKA